MDIKQTILDQLSGQATDTIAAKERIDSGSANAAIDAALTAILSGLQQNVTESNGAEKLDGAVGKDHDGSVLDDIIASIQSSDVQSDGADILSHVFGSKKGKVASKVAKESGVSTSTATDIMGTLAPIILGQLGKSKQSGGLDAGGLASEILRQQLPSGGVGDVVQQVLSGKQTGLAAILLSLFKTFFGKK